MEHSFLLACFIFLSAAVIVVPFAKATGLGSVLGYLLAGIIIGPLWPWPGYRPRNHPALFRIWRCHDAVPDRA